MLFNQFGVVQQRAHLSGPSTVECGVLQDGKVLLGQGVLAGYDTDLCQLLKRPGTFIVVGNYSMASKAARWDMFSSNWRFIVSHGLSLHKHRNPTRHSQPFPPYQ